MIISIPFIMLAVFFIQRVYLRTSRQLRFLDLETRSPVYSHFLETLEGIVTIRAFDWQQEAAKENIRRLDDSQKPYYLLYCIQRWLALALDLMSAGMAIIVVALATSLRHTTSPGFLGVSMNNVLCE
jgi:ABC-type multidrug transport system fused ATPase/permease subunit